MPPKRSKGKEPMGHGPVEDTPMEDVSLQTSTNDDLALEARPRKKAKATKNKGITTKEGSPNEDETETKADQEPELPADFGGTLDPYMAFNLQTIPVPEGGWDDLITILENDQTHDGDEEGQALPTIREILPTNVSGPGRATGVNRPAIDRNLPPLSDISLIFRDLVSNATTKGLEVALKDLAKAECILRVATLCSGTEAPILALQLIQEAFTVTNPAITFEFEHLFSAEIEPFKQAYIERNFRPPILFRDIVELARTKSGLTAYGSVRDIPKGIDILIAGSSCVDYSSLNVSKPTQNGESENTFKAVISLAAIAHPTIVILENVDGAPWANNKARWERAGYRAEFCKVDTKDFYLPQTRQRGYMICIRNDLQGAQTAVEQFRAVVKSLQRRASCPAEDFMLPDTDPKVIQATEEILRTGQNQLGRKVEWIKCKGEYRTFREDLQLGRQRPYTNWRESASNNLPDHACKDWGKFQVERVLDSLDVAYLLSVKRGFDFSYKSRVLELSQSINRTQDNNPFGICPCITPTGIPFLTSQGRQMVGLESLALQGIPIDKLLLTRESQKNLQDLAGNAMTTTVVGAVLISALILAYNCVIENRTSDQFADVKASEGKAIASNDYEFVTQRYEGSALVFKPKSNDTRDLFAGAKATGCHCHCEKGLVVIPRKILTCQKCGHTACTKCAGNPRHVYGPPLSRPHANPVLFESLLLAALPKRCKFGKFPHLSDFDNGELLGDRVRRALNGEFRFQSIRRSEVWTAIYESQYGHLEATLSSSQIVWRIYAKPSANDLRSIQQELVPHFGEMVIKHPTYGLTDGLWKFRSLRERTVPVRISGVGIPVPSFEQTVGLQGEEFTSKKVFPILRVETPGNAGFDSDINGEYTLLQDCGTSLGCLHQRDGSSPGEGVYLFLDPGSIQDQAEDCFVFAQHKNWLGLGQRRPLIARLPSFWRPGMTQGNVKLQCVAVQPWISSPNTELVTSEEDGCVALHPVPGRISVNYGSCRKRYISMLDVTVALESNKDECYTWAQGDWQYANVNSEAKVLQDFAWLINSVQGLKNYDEILTEPMSVDVCLACYPQKPNIKWKWTEKGHRCMPVAYEDFREAGYFEASLKSRPRPFMVRYRIDDADYGHLEIGLNVTTLLHRAVSTWVEGKGELGLGTELEPELSWSLTTDYAPLLSERYTFTIPNNDHDTLASQPLHFKKALFDNQRRSLSWMLRMDVSGCNFTEEEVEEACLAGTKWRAEGVAKHTTSFRGGVLADKVGFGKTITTLALISSTLEDDKRHAQQSRDEDKMADAFDSVDKDAGLIRTHATLILVPKTIISQWRSEITECLGTNCRVVLLRDINDLKRTRIRDIEQADIVLVSVKLLEGSYLKRLASLAGLWEPPTSTGRAFGAWYTQAVQRLLNHLDILKTQGPQALDNFLEQQRSNDIASNTLVNLVPEPSRRKKGKKRGASDEKEIKDINDKSEQPSNKKTFLERFKEELKLSDEFFEKPVGKGFTLTGTDYRDITSPLLEFFDFRRLVVDEFSYLEKTLQTCVPKMNARSRWILSGTPPLDSFMSIKSFASLLDINLGVDEVQDTATNPELFQSYAAIHSPYWHKRRDAVAQRFLNSFTRANQPAANIKSSEEFRCVVLPGGEMSLYLELQNTIVAQDMRLKMPRQRHAAGDRSQQALLRSKINETPEGVLLGSTSFFDSEGYTRRAKEANLETDGWNPAAMAGQMFTLRLHELQTTFIAIVKEFRQALDLEIQVNTWIDQHGSAPDETYLRAMGRWAALIKEFHNNEYGDMDVSKVLRSTFERLKEEPRGISVVPDDSAAKSLREACSQIRGLATKLVEQKRAVRFSKTVQATIKSTNANVEKEPLKCSHCKDYINWNGGFHISTFCGHSYHKTCLEQAGKNEGCSAFGCLATMDVGSAPSSDLFRPVVQDSPISSVYGEKMRRILHLIFLEINNHEKVIIFCQFSTMIKMVTEAIRKFNINCENCLEGALAADKVITKFKTNSSLRILILDPTNSTAAGANLTMANHVIFLFPLSGLQRPEYMAKMEQAIGRAKRYGQKKNVYIYHFLALRTIDVNVIEEKREQILVKRSNTYTMVPKEQVQAGEGHLGSGALSEQYGNT
ncbi:MAG: hypothetical protein M1834_002592 [Cirrosporium novae-zelandiae]|nr:MAG: hypothetical protein M1834_002592 [Cirrosporium novae-zelandiae]